MPEIQIPPIDLVVVLQLAIVFGWATLLMLVDLFVPPGRKPRVVVRSERAGEYIRIWVEDNGIGIKPEYHEKVFELFQRLHAPDKYSGTGVGLAIVKKAVERMGGTVGFESEPGRGSRFWIELQPAEK